MIEWEDEGIIVATKTHGENGKILSVLTESNGLYRGYCPGAQSKKKTAFIQIGNQISLSWKSRLQDQLGQFKCESLYQTNAYIMNDYQALCAVQSACLMLDQLLPERSLLPHIYHGLEVLIKNMTHEGWQILYIKWELELLKALGFGLVLDVCTVTGSKEDLVAVSPNTGRAVCREVAIPYGDKLLQLPDFLLADKERSLDKENIQLGLNLTGHFLETHLFHPIGKIMPKIRYEII